MGQGWERDKPGWAVREVSIIRKLPTVGILHGNLCLLVRGDLDICPLIYICH